MSILLMTACHLFANPEIVGTCETPEACGTTTSTVTGTGTATGNQDRDGDGWTPDQGDCDDGNADVHPGAEEDCNTSYDDDCSGSDNDEDALHCIPYYEDADGDGYGTGSAHCLCYPTGAYASSTDVDCDDGDADRFPGNAETCGDGVDQDCDGDDAVCSYAIAVVYVSDSAGAADLADLLTDYGLDARSIDAATTTEGDLADNDVIVVPAEAVSVDWTPHAATVKGAGPPVLGMGIAGFDYFTAIGSPLADPNYVYDMYLAISPVDPGHPIFTTPFDLSTVNPPMRLAQSEVPAYGLDVDAGIVGVEYLGVAYADPGVSLVSAAGREFLWSMDTQAGKLSEEGEQLLVNVINWLASQ